MTLTIEASSISEDGGAATATVTRNNIDISQPLTVTLVSNDASETTVPHSVTIDSNATSATFTIEAVDDALLDGSQSVGVWASASSYVPAQGTIDVSDHETLALTIKTVSISEFGGGTTATISRSNIDDFSQPLTVTIVSGDATEASVPANVTIPANQASADFTIAAVDDALLDGVQVAQVTASALGFVSAVADLAVVDHETLTISIDLASLSEQAGMATATITRSDTAGPALNVNLRVNDTSEAIVPETSIIPAGAATATVTISAVDDDLLDGVQVVTMTAAAGGYISVATASVEVTDHETLAISLSHSSVAETGGAITATVIRRNTDTGGPLEVSLTSSDTTEATVPATVTIPAGQQSADFLIAPRDDAESDGAQMIQISAAAAGYVEATADVSITDNAFPWHNSANPLDVNADGNISPIDVLLVFNQLNDLGARLLPTHTVVVPPYLDVNADRFVAPIDALLVINFLDRSGSGQPEADGGLASLGITSIVAVAPITFSETLSHGARLPELLQPRQVDAGAYSLRVMAEQTDTDDARQVVLEASEDDDWLSLSVDDGTLDLLATEITSE